MSSFLSDEEWRSANFTAVMRSLPIALRAFDDGAACPWCGCFHETVTFGAMSCDDCKKGFVFGYPQQWPSMESGRPETWVNFPWKKFDGLNGNGSLFPKFEPNEALKEIYEFWRKHDEGNSGSPSFGSMH